MATAMAEPKTGISIPTQAKLAVEMAVSQRTVNTWASKPDFPRNEDGSYPLARIIEWRIRRDIDLSGADDDLKERKLRAEIAKLEADAAAKEIKNAIVRGELYHAREVDYYLRECAVLVKSRLEQFPVEVAAETPPDYRNVAHETATKCVHRLLLELSTRKFTASGETEED